MYNIMSIYTVIVPNKIYQKNINEWIINSKVHGSYSEKTLLENTRKSLQDISCFI